MKSEVSKSPRKSSPKKKSPVKAQTIYPSVADTFTYERVEGDSVRAKGTMLTSGYFIPRSFEDADTVEYSMYEKLKIDEEKVFVDALIKGKIVDMGYVMAQGEGKIRLYGDHGDYKIGSSIPIRFRMFIVDEE
jgi:hypothetical protein